MVTVKFSLCSKQSRKGGLLLKSNETGGRHTHRRGCRKDAKWSASGRPVIRALLNTLRPRQNGRHFAGDTFNRIFVNENVRISIKISLKFVPKGPINNNPALVQIMAWRRPGDKPLSEPMMVRSLTHICVTRPQWVKPPLHRQGSDLRATFERPGNYQDAQRSSKPTEFCFCVTVAARLLCLPWTTKTAAVAQQVTQRGIFMTKNSWLLCHLKLLYYIVLYYLN